MRANSGIDPGKLLLTVLQLLSGEEALPVVMAVEETFPGTIRTAMDKSGRNALWYALRYHKRWPGITECSSSRAEEIDQYFIEHGCDVMACSKDGFSWNVMSRLLRAIELFGD